MSFKIFFSDIDGTLLNSHRDLSELTISEIKRIKSTIPIILVSARMPKQMYYLQEKLEILKSPLICYNGALVLTDESIIHSQEIPLDHIEHLVDYNENVSPSKFHISLYNNDDWYVEEYDYWAKREENNTKVSPEIKSNREVIKLWKEKSKGAHKITCMGDASIIETAFNYLKNKFNDSLHLYRSKDTYIEIANKKVSKLTGINKLLETCYATKLHEAIAFGDNYNDVEMVKAVGHGVAVSNARDEVKQVAKAITDNHYDDGVAKYLQKIFS